MPTELFESPKKEEYKLRAFAQFAQAIQSKLGPFDVISVIGPGSLYEILEFAEHVGNPHNKPDLQPIQLSGKDLTKREKFLNEELRKSIEEGKVRILGTLAQQCCGLTLYEAMRIIPLWIYGNFPPDIQKLLQQSNTQIPTIAVLLEKARSINQNLTHPFSPDKRTLILARRPEPTTAQLFFTSLYLRNIGNQEKGYVALFQFLALYDLRYALYHYFKQIKTNRKTNTEIRAALIPFIRLQTSILPEQPQTHERSDLELFKSFWKQLIELNEQAQQDPKEYKNLRKFIKPSNHKQPQFIDDCCIFLLVPKEIANRLHQIQIPTWQALEPLYV